MSAMDQITDRLALYAGNFTSQARTSIERMTPEQWLRLVVIACGYALLRPYLLKLGGKHQQADHERALDLSEAQDLQRASGKVVRDPRDGALRERADVPEDTDSGSEGEGPAGKSAGADWGKKARRRQRRVVRTLLEQEERRKEMEVENESDKEIEDLLVE